MRFDLITIFPDFFAGPLDYGIVRRALEAALVDVTVHDLRKWTHDRHQSVDDRPFGGGEGMVLKPEPLFEAVESILERAAPISPQSPAAYPVGTGVVLLSASGKLFRQADARRLATLQRIVLLCGRYEGVDERVAEHLATEELSIGDFVLSGGEIAAALMVDTVTRLLPGALGNEASSANESFSESLGPSSPALASPSLPISNFQSPPSVLDCPHYTRPADFRGWSVPETLLSGNHAEIAKWRRATALAKTLRNRPDLAISTKG